VAELKRPRVPFFFLCFGSVFLMPLLAVELLSIVAQDGSRGGDEEDGGGWWWRWRFFLFLPLFFSLSLFSFSSSSRFLSFLSLLSLFSSFLLCIYRKKTWGERPTIHVQSWHRGRVARVATMQPPQGHVPFISPSW
jgi:hypothetical protein